MTHTETTRESACHLERASRCLASLANAMSEARRITDAICHALSDVARAGAVFRTTGNVADRKSTRLNSSHQIISYAVFCLKKKNNASIRYDAGRGAVSARCAGRRDGRHDWLYHRFFF